MCKFLKFKKFENNVILNYGKENLLIINFEFLEKVYKVE